MIGKVHDVLYFLDLALEVLLAGFELELVVGLALRDRFDLGDDQHLVSVEEGVHVLGEARHVHEKPVENVDLAGGGSLAGY